MAKLNRNWTRRRWALGLLFMLLMTVSMMGPAQALSGVKNASAAVIDTLAAMVSPDKPTAPKPVASAAATSSWIDGALTPDFTSLSFGTEPPSGEAISAAPGATDNPPAAVGSAASSATQREPGGQGGSFGAWGRPAYQGAGGSGLGLGAAGAGAGIETLAASDQGLAQELAVFDISQEAATFAFDPGIADAGAGFQPGAPVAPSPGGSGPGGSDGIAGGSDGIAGGSDGIAGGSDGIAGGSDGTDTGGAGLPTAFEPPGPDDQALPPTPYADGTVPPAVITDLLDDLDVPSPGEAGPALSQTVPGFDLSQVPEPSTIVLISLGLAALRHRSRQVVRRR